MMFYPGTAVCRIAPAAHFSTLVRLHGVGASGGGGRSSDCLRRDGSSSRAYEVIAAGDRDTHKAAMDILNE
eukprot:1189435-Prorocentrum_minimum.AAC.7